MKGMNLLRKMIVECLLGTQGNSEVTYQNGVLKIRGKIYLGNGGNIIDELHSTQ